MDAQIWPSLLDLAQVIKPETILRWHRAGFKAFWRWKSRNRVGRPKINRGLRDLIQRMSRKNLMWGASRIHGELLNLGFEVAQSTASKYMVRGETAPSPSWKTFLQNHAQAIAENASSLKTVAQSNFQFRWVVGAETQEEGIEIAKKFTLKDVAQHITCPFLAPHSGNDRVVPVENTQKLYDAVGSKNKMIKIFTTEEGRAQHAYVDSRQVGIDFAADWLEDNM
jgi:Serine aminopeptidase, S33